MESMISNSGLTASTCWKITSRLVSVTRYSSCGNPRVLFRRAARILICFSDSSPETYSTRLPVGWLAISIVTCNISVDFPIPGSPPTSTIEPGTIPPPSTRANSLIESGRRSSALPSISCKRTGLDWMLSPRWPFLLGDGSGAITSSIIVLNCPHCGQRPIMRAEIRPHS